LFIGAKQGMKKIVNASTKLANKGFVDLTMP